MSDSDIQPAEMASRPRILVAEDNFSNYKLVEVLLRRDYDLTHALNGEQAVEAFSQGSFDLVLMDINMPVMDGYEALRRIREIDPDMPVVSLTAYAFEADRQRMFAAGFTDCLSKPLRTGELRGKITGYLEQAHKNEK